MVFREKGHSPLEVFLKCAICNNLVPYELDMCVYCGGVISYDEDETQYYISERICFRCGFQNKADSLNCEECKSKFVIACPKCKNEVEAEEVFCKKCGFRIDEFHIENEVNKRLSLQKTEHLKKMGLYAGGTLFLLMTLFLIYLSLENLNERTSRYAFVAGAVIFCSLFVMIIKSLLGLKGEKGRRGG